MSSSWGHMIVFSAFMIQVVSFGIAQSIGVFTIYLLEYFNSSVAATSMIGALNYGLLLGAGPIASWLMRKIGYKRVALLGALLSSIGLLCCPFAPNVLYLNIFFGVLTGLGFCFLYIPSHTLSGLYFDKHRSLATGIATSGSGLGGALFPVITYYLIQEYSWRGSMLVMAGLNLNNFVFSLLLREPPELQLCDTTLESSDKQLIESEPHLDDISDGICVKDSSATTPLNTDVRKSNLNSNEEDELSPPAQTKSTKTKHFYVLCNISFLLFFISNVFWNMGSASVMVLGPEYFIEFGLSKENAAIALTVFGGTITVGGVLGGAVGNLKFINRVILYIFSTFTCGILILFIALTLTHNMVGLTIVMALLGLMFGMLLGLLVVVTADIVGVELLGDGMGYLMLANGIGCTIGPPVGGWIKDATSSYNLTFYLCGMFTILGSIVMTAVPIRDRFCNRK